MIGWIGVDLDGTLAEYNGWEGVDHIGPPVPLMLERVKAWMEEGTEVRIFTARVSVVMDSEEGVKAEKALNAWMMQHIGRLIPVTCCKDFGMIELWDDRAVRVQHNTGLRFL